jgi:Uma2 family endonuclease
VVDPEGKEIRVFMWRDGAYEEQEVLRGEGRLRSPLFPGVEADAAKIFA